MQDGKGTTQQLGQYAQSKVKPDHINLAIGQPTPRLLDLIGFKNAFDKIFSAEAVGVGPSVGNGGGSGGDATSAGAGGGGSLDPLVLQYGAQNGFEDFRKDLAQWLTYQYGFPVLPGELMVSGGNSMAIQFVIRNYIQPGDVIVMDDPTYFLVGNIVKASGAKVQLVKSDPVKGLDVEDLRSFLEQSDAGKRTKMVYCIPIHQNPTGVSIAPERAKALVELAEQHDFYVLADEPYPILNHLHDSTGKTFSGSEQGDGAARATSIKQYDSQSKRVISLGTFSKILAPGLRLGMFSMFLLY